MGERKKKPEADRFYAKTQRLPNGCLRWMANTVHARGNSRYGSFYFRGKSVLAHRAIWIMTYGPIEPGMEIDHLCKNPLCVEITHLAKRTPLEHQRQHRRCTDYTAEFCINGHSLKENLHPRAAGLRGRGFCRLCYNEYKRRRSAAAKLRNAAPGSGPADLRNPPGQQTAPAGRDRLAK